MVARLHVAFQELQQRNCNVLSFGLDKFLLPLIEFGLGGDCEGSQKLCQFQFLGQPEDLPSEKLRVCFANRDRMF